jgi:hypothetical protein
MSPSSTAFLDSDAARETKLQISDKTWLCASGEAIFLPLFTLFAWLHNSKLLSTLHAEELCVDNGTPFFTPFKGWDWIDNDKSSIDRIDWFCGYSSWNASFKGVKKGVPLSTQSSSAWSVDSSFELWSHAWSINGHANNSSNKQGGKKIASPEAQSQVLSEIWSFVSRAASESKKAVDEGLMNFVGRSDSLSL